MQQIAAVLQVFRLCGRMTFAADRPTRPFDPEARKLSAGFSLRRKKSLIATIRACHKVEKLAEPLRKTTLPAIRQVSWPLNCFACGSWKNSRLADSSESARAPYTVHDEHAAFVRQTNHLCSSNTYFAHYSQKV
ncbi:MAG: hypothetical protein SOY87_09545 [Eggerthella lenta]|nr:hypothetical protein [Eggerthella lenta]